MTAERLYSDSDEATHQLTCIWVAREKAYAQIAVIAQELRAEVNCFDKDIACLMDHVHDGLSDMLDGVTTRWTDERDNADVTISNIEERDLQLSRVA